MNNAWRGGVYRVTVWCKEEKVNPGTKISVWLGYKKNDKWMDFSLRTDASYVANEQQGQWRKVVLYTTAPNDANARLTLVLGGSNSQMGYIYFDNIKIETCTQPK